MAQNNKRSASRPTTVARWLGHIPRYDFTEWRLLSNREASLPSPSRTAARAEAEARMAEAGAAYFEANRAYQESTTDANSNRLINAYLRYFRAQNFVLANF